MQGYLIKHSSVLLHQSVYNIKPHNIHIYVYITMSNDEAQQYFLNRNKLELMSVAYCEFQGIFMEPNT